jgi:TolB-like protein
VALGYLAFDKFFLDPQRDAELVESLQQVKIESAKVGAGTSEAPDAAIAVLPFVNMSDDKSQEYFSDGISEELLNVLSPVEGLRVSSRTSSFAFKGVNRNIREIAAILGVNYIVEGSVRKAGNRVRITAQLIDTNADQHMWSDTFDRELIDIFTIQDEISRAIVSALREALGLAETTVVAVSEATQNMDAYDLYLQAKGLDTVMTTDSRKLKVEMLQQAVEKDPGFTRASISLANALMSLPNTWPARGSSWNR